MGFLSHKTPSNTAANMQIAYGNQQAKYYGDQAQGFATQANNTLDYLGNQTLDNNTAANASYQNFKNQYSAQLAGQQQQLDALLGPKLTAADFQPGVMPGVMTSALGDQSKANVGRNSLLGF